MSEIIHKSEGLTIKRNERNGFVVATLFFYADPAKRDPKWVQEASLGMTPEKVQQELYIDYTAILGAKVFPEITSRRTEIVIPPFDIGRSVRCWGGFDYGSRNPSSFHVYTILDGITYSIYEIYEPCKNISEFAQKIKDCPYYYNLQYIAADPACWAPTQQQSIGNPISIIDLFIKEGVKKFLKGRNDGQAEDAFVAMIRNAWHAEEPQFKIFDICHNQIDEFAHAVYSNQSERQLLTSVYRETIADKDNHSIDECKYFFLSRPPIRPVTNEATAKLDLRWSQTRSKAQPRKAIGGYN